MNPWCDTNNKEIWNKRKEILRFQRRLTVAKMELKYDYKLEE
jgi:hypothetical protein